MNLPKPPRIKCENKRWKSIGLKKEDPMKKPSSNGKSIDGKKIPSAGRSRIIFGGMINDSLKVPQLTWATWPSNSNDTTYKSTAAKWSQIDMNETNENKNSGNWWSKINKITLFASIISAIIATITGLISYSFLFEDRIVDRFLDKLKSREIIQQIASLVRPSVIFDQNGTILHNSGGAQFIRKDNGILVDMTTPENLKVTPQPKKILIFPTEHLNEPLILECLNRNMDFKCKRVNTINWECEVYSPTYFTAKGSISTGEWRFRLEVVP